MKRLYILLLLIVPIVTFAQKFEFYKEVNQTFAGKMKWSFNPKLEYTKMSDATVVFNNNWQNVDSCQSYTVQTTEWQIDWIPDSVYEDAWAFEMVFYNMNDNRGRPDVKNKYDIKTSRNSRDYYVFPADKGLKPSKQRALHYSSIYNRVAVELVFDDYTTEVVWIDFVKNVNRRLSYNVRRNGKWNGWKSHNDYYHSDNKTPKLYISYQPYKSGGPIGINGYVGAPSQEEKTMIQWGLGSRDCVTFYEIPNKRCVGIKTIEVGGSSLAKIVAGRPVVRYKKANPIPHPSEGDFIPMVVRPIINKK